MTSAKEVRLVLRAGKGTESKRPPGTPAARCRHFPSHFACHPGCPTPDRRLGYIVYLLLSNERKKKKPRFITATSYLGSIFFFFFFYIKRILAKGKKKMKYKKKSRLSPDPVKKIV